MRCSTGLVEKTAEGFHHKWGRKPTDVETKTMLERLGSLAIVADAVESGNACVESTHDRASGSARRDRWEGCVAPRGGHAEKSQNRGGTELVSQYPQTPVDGDD